MPCSDHAVLLKATAQHGRLSTAVLCRGLEKNGIVRAWHGRGMASVNQTRPHCANQMGKTHSKPLAARHAGDRHGRGMLCVIGLYSPTSFHPEMRTTGTSCASPCSIIYNLASCVALPVSNRTNWMRFAMHSQRPTTPL